MTEPIAKVARPWIRFGLRSIFLWTFALACAFNLGKIKEQYEPYLGDVGQLLLLLAIVILGVGSGGLSGKAMAEGMTDNPIFHWTGAIMGAVFGVAILFAAFLLYVTMN